MPERVLKLSVIILSHENKLNNQRLMCVIVPSL